MSDASVGTKPLWLREFSDMPADAVPELPVGWIDESWGNDVCPRFHHQEAGLVLWVDYPDRAMREFPEMPRLTLTHAAVCGESEEHIISYEEWEDMRAELAARGFL